MNYTYKIRRLDTLTGFMSVVYSYTGKPDIYKNFNPTDFSEAALRAMVEAHGQRVVEQWEAMEAPPVAELAEGATGTGTALPRRYATPPVYDRQTQTIEEVWTAQNGVNQQSWQINDLPSSTVLANKVAEVAADRYLKEHAGITWTDAAGDTWFLDTQETSQIKFASTRLAVESGDRVSGSVWKCARITATGPVLTFRPTTNAEMTQMASLVHAYVQKCFDAEGAAVNKLMAGDLTATFQTEFDAL